MLFLQSKLSEIMDTEIEQLKYHIISSIVALNDINSLSEVKKFLKNTFQLTENTDSKTKHDETLFWKITSLAALEYEKAVEELSNQPLSYLFEFEEMLAQKLYQLDKKKLAMDIYCKEHISKDDFLYARCFIVCQGEFFYEKILNEEIQMVNQTFEPLLYLSEKVYFEKTQKEFPILPTSVSYETGSNKAEWI